MGKHTRKKQKTIISCPPRNAKLDQLLDDDAKDDEERKLESMLFGLEYVSRNKEKDPVTNIGEGEGAGREMQHLVDTELFFVDEGETSILGSKPSSGNAKSNTESSQSDDEDSRTGHDDEDSRTGHDDEDSQTGHEVSDFPKYNPLLKKPQTSVKPPAWTDLTDQFSSTAISLLSGPSRLRKLRIAADEDAISGHEYETRLRRQFERIHPAPAWATKGVNMAGSDTDDEKELDALFSSTTGILATSRRNKNVLPVGALGIERLRDANLSSQGAGIGEVKVVAFNPNENISVLGVATADRRVRLYSVDGHTNPLVQTLHTPTLPYTHTSLSFHPSGSSLLLTGPRPYFFVHDLQTGTTSRHERGLWGSSDDSISLGRKRGRKEGGTGKEVPILTAFSPGGGDILAVGGRGGYVHLVDWRSGAAQVIGSLNCGAGGGIHGLWWVPPNGAEFLRKEDGGADAQLAVMNGDAEVYIWNVGQRRCVRRWRDEGGFRGAGRVLSGSSSCLAVGSNTGLVNVYGADSTSPHLSETPKPIKTIANLTTAISTIRFNHDSQILAIASKEKKDAMRLIHLPSITAFANWPTSSTPLGHVTGIDFSPRSNYVAIGNTRGRVLLYNLKDYGYARNHL